MVSCGSGFSVAINGGTAWIGLSLATYFYCLNFEPKAAFTGGGFGPFFRYMEEKSGSAEPDDSDSLTLSSAREETFGTLAKWG